MSTHWMLLPVLLNLFLVFVVQVHLYRQRISYLREHRIDPQSLATRDSAKQQLSPLAAASDNFQNQFELPVIFYVVVAFMMITGWASWFDFYLALGFVVCRILHATIHLTNNRVIWRFYAYTLSMWLCWALLASLSASWLRDSGLLS